MDRVIVTGKTVKSALDKGLAKLKITEDEFDYKVIEEAKSGFFGLIGSRDAKVEVIKKSNKAEKASVFLENLLKEMDVEVEVEIINKDDQVVSLNLTGNDLGIVIGHRGDTLDALQYLTNLAINKGEEDYLKVLLDAEGYRERRRKTLENLALKMAKKSKDKGRKVMLEPMPAHERKVIHTVLQDVSNIKTYSIGKEPYRKVIIENSNE